ncbi:MAG TPA: hypothetical protein PK299_02745 [Anaerolineales bacterium]|nr:hypothetical protein [Anaerolineales bacterium]
MFKILVKDKFANKTSAGRQGLRGIWLSQQSKQFSRFEFSLPQACHYMAVHAPPTHR